MNNNTIILNNSIALAEKGILRTTENFITLDNGNIIYLPEAIHTYKGWQELGYQVKKGEKAIAAFKIWKYKKSNKSDEDLETETQTISSKNMIMVNSFWFKADQVTKNN